MKMMPNFNFLTEGEHSLNTEVGAGTQKGLRSIADLVTGQDIFMTQSQCPSCKAIVRV